MSDVTKVEYVVCLDEASQNKAPFVEKGVIYRCHRFYYYDTNEYKTSIFIDGWAEPAVFEAKRFTKVNLNRSNYIIAKKSVFIEAVAIVMEEREKLSTNGETKPEMTNEQLSAEFEKLTI